MADLVVLEFCGEPAAFTLEELEAARARALTLLSTRTSPSPGSPAEPLLDAEHAAEQLGVTARWLEDCARAGIVPHHKLGRFIRFRVSDVAAHFQVAGAPPPTDSQSFPPIRRLARQ